MIITYNFMSRSGEQIVQYLQLPVTQIHIFIQFKFTKFSKMKIDPVVNNNDELFISNMGQVNKIKYLESEKNKREAYIKDLQQTLQLNKSSISQLASDKNNLAILKLNEENQFLHLKLKKYYQQIMNTNASLLIEQQLRIQQKKFYSQRILDFETNMIELRKYLQDKQDSFSSVVTRLKKYEDLTQVTLQTKLHKLSAEIGEDNGMNLLKKLTEERDKYKSVYDKYKIDLDDLTFLRNCLEKKQCYEKLQISYSKFKQIQKQSKDKDDKNGETYEKTKNTTSNTFNKNIERTVANPGVIKNPHRELIKLLKKQKLNNEILQQALNEAIEKNQQLILENSKLVEANEGLQIKIAKIQSKGYLLEQQLSAIDSSLQWKQQWKSKCDIDRIERIKEFEHKGEEDEICMIALQQDMEKLSSFIINCVPNGKLIKSSSNPNLNSNKRNQDVIEEGDDIEIEQL